MAIICPYTPTKCVTCQWYRHNKDERRWECTIPGLIADSLSALSHIVNTDIADLEAISSSRDLDKDEEKTLTAIQKLDAQDFQMTGKDTFRLENEAIWHWFYPDALKDFKRETKLKEEGVD